MMSSPDPNQDEPPTAVRAGADLRAARERLGWDLPEIASGLRIRQAHLEALEDGRIDLLPGHAYALGFVRTYATSLGLDPEEIVRRFKAEAGEVTGRTELAFPAPMPERGVPAGAIVLLGLVLAVGAYAGWYRLSGEGQLPPETTTIPQRLAPLARQAPVVKLDKPPTQLATAAQTPEPAPTSAEAAEPPPQSISPTSAAAAAVTQPSAVAQQVPPAAGAQTQPMPNAQPAVLASTSGQQAGATPPQATAVPAAPAGATPAPATVSPSDAVVATQQQTHVILRATADAWVQVRDKSGQVLLNRILHAGDSWSVPNRPNLLLTTGNAGGTELVVDGVSTGVLGNPGAVRRDLPLNPALIKQGALNPASADGMQSASIRAASR